MAQPALSSRNSTKSAGTVEVVVAAFLSGAALAGRRANSGPAWTATRPPPRRPRRQRRSSPAGGASAAILGAGARRLAIPGPGHRRLAQADPAVVGRHPAVEQDAEA